MCNTSHISSIESNAIDWMRFPLAVAVVFIHTSNTAIPLCDVLNNTPPHQFDFYANLIELTCSRILSWVAVPIFFILSGYLYFVKTGTEKPCYIQQIKKRIHTLLIPYLIWNLIPIIVFSLKIVGGTVLYDKGIIRLWDYLSNINWLHIFWDYNYNGELPNILGYAYSWTTPINGPLWFIRDLFIMCLFAPLIFMFIKRFKIWSVLFCVFLFLTNISIPLPGFDPKAVMFFSLGAYMGIFNRSLFQYSKPTIISFVILTILTFLLAAYYTDNLCVNLFILSAMPLCFHTAYKLSLLPAFRPLSMLTDSCFFIYASHLIVILPTFCSYASLLLPNKGCGYELLRYFSAPFLCVMTLVVINAVLRYFMPKTMSFICGR